MKIWRLTKRYQRLPRDQDADYAKDYEDNEKYYGKIDQKGNAGWGYDMEIDDG